MSDRVNYCPVEKETMSEETNSRSGVVEYSLWRSE